MPARTSDERRTSEARLSAVIKSARDIMRKDAGLNGDLDRLPQLSWLLFFEKTEPTKEVWFYQLPPPEGRRRYTKTKPLRFDEFADCIDWWQGEKREGREETERAWRVSIADIQANNYNLDLANPNAGDDLAHSPPEELIKDLITTEREILDLLSDLERLADADK